MSKPGVVRYCYSCDTEHEGGVWAGDECSVTLRKQRIAELLKGRSHLEARKKVQDAGHRVADLAEDLSLAEKDLVEAEDALLAADDQAKADAAVRQAEIDLAQAKHRAAGRCGCGSTKYGPNHLPQDHAGWSPE